jgi:hypothetical protein
MVLPDPQLRKQSPLRAIIITQNVLVFFLANWPSINRFVDECYLHSEIKRSIKSIRPNMLTGPEYRIDNNEVVHNYIFLYGKLHPLINHALNYLPDLD